MNILKIISYLYIFLKFKARCLFRGIQYVLNILDSITTYEQRQDKYNT
jgi:hypothetical protein